MSTYRVRFMQMLELTVEVDAADEGDAEDKALAQSQAYLATLTGGEGVSVDHTNLDGLGADEVTELGGGR